MRSVILVLSCYNHHIHSWLPFFSQWQPALPIECYVKQVAREIRFFYYYLSAIEMLGHATSCNLR